MNAAPPRHLVLIPSYNPGESVFETVRGARQYWDAVWVVVDGSDDGPGERLEAAARDDPALRVLRLARNGGKGAAVLHGMRVASAEGFTHVLTMDSDGQHPPTHIPRFMAASVAAPRAVVLGVPQFDESAPSLRVKGRRISGKEHVAARLSAIPMNAIDRIVILRGAGAVLYGGGATGGTINIITRSPIGTHPSGSISATVGSHRLRDLRGSAESGSECWVISINARHYENDNYRQNKRP